VADDIVVDSLPSKLSEDIEIIVGTETVSDATKTDSSISSQWSTFLEMKSIQINPTVNAVGSSDSNKVRL